MSLGLGPARKYPPEGGLLKAGPRDASWYNYPDVYSAKVYHLTEDWVTTLCGRMVCEFALIDPTEAPVNNRCKHPACAKRWPE